MNFTLFAFVMVAYVTLVDLASCKGPRLILQRNADLAEYIQEHEQELAGFLDKDVHDYTFRSYATEHRTFSIVCMVANGVFVRFDEQINSGEIRMYLIHPANPRYAENGNFSYSAFLLELNEEELQQVLDGNIPEEVGDYEAEWESWDQDFRDHVINNVISI